MKKHQPRFTTQTAPIMCRLPKPLHEKLRVSALASDHSMNMEAMLRLSHSLENFESVQFSITATPGKAA